MDRRLTRTLAAAALAVAPLAAAACKASPARVVLPPDVAAAYGASPGATVTAASPIARADVGRIDAAIQRYAADRAGRLPTSLEALSTDRGPDGSPYMSRIPTDPWGRPYAYAVLNVRHGAYDLRSYGPDRTPGTDDDVVARAEPVSTH